MAPTRPTRSPRGLTRRDLLRLAGGGLGVSLAHGSPALLRQSVGLAAQETTIVVGTLINIKTLDPGRELENGTNNIDHVTYDTLVTFAGEDVSRPLPSLATSWKISSDGKMYTFTLRPNVKFASGNPFTAAEMKWSLDRQMNIKGNAAFLMSGVEEVLAPDPMTIVLRLSEPRPAILPILTDPALSAVDSKVVMANGGDAGPDAKEKDKAEAYLNAHSAGTGPFVLSSYVPEQEIVLVKNPTHWRGAPKIDRVVIRNIKEPADQELMIKRGDLSIATGIGPDQVRALQGVPGVTVKTSLALNVVNLVMNQNPEVGGPFSNPKIQQAVRYALDYTGLMKIAGPGAVRLAGVIPTNLPGALPSSQAVKTDRAKAVALLKDAGLGEVKGVLSFSSTTVFNGIGVSLIAQKVQADLGAVGIQLTLNDLPYGIAIQRYRDGKSQIGVWGWVADYPDVSDYLVFLPGRTVGKRAGWLDDSSPQVRDLLTLGHAAETEINDAKRIAMYQKLDGLLAAAGPYIPLFQPVTPYAYRSNLHGVTFTSEWLVDYSTVSA